MNPLVEKSWANVAVDLEDSRKPTWDPDLWTLGHARDSPARICEMLELQAVTISLIITRNFALG